MLFSRSIIALNTKIEATLRAGKINLALQSIYNFVEQIITEPIYTAQIFASRDLDEMCMRIGRANISNHDFLKEKKLSVRKSKKLVVYVVSSLQKSGGHTRLVQNFIKAQAENQHLILSTEVGGASDKKYFANQFKNIRNIQIEYAPRGSFSSRLTWLQSKLLDYHPKYVHLLNHHQDSVAVAAIVPEMGLNCSFYHHGDHHLCLGVYLEHLSHVDLHPMGFYHCCDELSLNNRYLPLTFEDKGYEPCFTEFKFGGAITTATIARYNKVEVPYYVSYLDAIALILKTTGGRHVHVGKLTPWGLNRIYKQMRKYGVNNNCFIYIDWVSDVWNTLKEYKVDVYISSFPYGGGLTLIESQGAGIPVIVHRHVHSRVLSCLELAYPGAFSWEYIEELLKHLTELTPGQLEIESGLARRHYERHHHSDILVQFFKATDGWRLVPDPLIKTFMPRWIDWAICIQMQQSISQLIYRKIYRLLRKIRRLVQKLQN